MQCFKTDRFRTVRRIAGKEAVERIGPLPTSLIAMLSLAAWPAMGQVLTGPIVNPDNGHEYYLLDRDTWTNSQAEAIALGGNLVTVSNAAEQEWLEVTFGPIDADNDPRAFWIGLFSPSGPSANPEDYEWVSGEAVTYTNWGDGEPNGGSSGFAYIGRFADGTWNDINNTNIQFFGVVEVIPSPGAASLLVAMGLCSVGHRRRTI